MVSDTRLYGAAIGVVSAGYSLWSASTATAMGSSGWLMALLGVVVLVHGVLLLTDYADRLGDASGPLMIGYSVLMLLNQALVGTGMTGGRGGMNGGMDGGTMGGTTDGMGWDAGMVALVILMLISGAIMTQAGDDGRM
ncbi:MAG: hypothetical protein ACOCQL_00680 [Halolamina sp.]